MEEGMVIRRFLLLGLLWTLVAGALPALAQGDPDVCPAIMTAALESTGDLCASTVRGEVCVGHPTVVADLFARAEDAGAVFARPGDRASAAAFQRLQAAALDPDAGTWGVVLARLGAGLPESPADLYLTLLLLGGVDLVPGVPPPPLFGLTPAGTVNVRRGPSTRDPIVGQFTPGQNIVTDGRLADSSWLRIRWEESHAWVFAELVRPQGDVAGLDVIDPHEPPLVYGPLQAFSLAAEPGNPACPGIPPGGLLAQTPDGAGEVTLLINQAWLHIAGTAWLRAEPGLMRVCAVAGGIRLQTRPGDAFALAGSCISLPLDDTPAPAAAPDPAEPFEATPLAPALALLPAVVPVPPPLTDDAIAALAVIPPSGVWQAVYDTAALSCPSGFGGPVDVSASNGPRDITFLPGGGRAELTEPETRQPLIFARTAPDVFSAATAGDDGTIEVVTWRIAAPDRLEGLSVLTFPDDCVVEAPFVLTLDR